MTLEHGPKHVRGAALMALGLVLFGSPFGCGDDDDHGGGNTGGEAGQGGDAGSAGTSSPGGAGGEANGGAGGAVAGRDGAGGDTTEGGTAGAGAGAPSAGSAGTPSEGGASGGSPAGGAPSSGGSPGEAGAGGIGGGESTEGTAGDVCIASFCGVGRKVCGGTCVDITDPAYGCGASSCDPCSKAILNASTACVKGSCSVVDCREGFADCNSNLGDGCEADLTTPTTCNTCGISCKSGEFCTPTGCSTTCPFPTTNCSGACRDLATSPESCGACATRCPAVAHGEATCTAGTCNTHPTCETGFTACGNECADLANDTEHCGDCDTDCTATKDPLGPYEAVRCENSACAVTCSNGFTRCGGECVSLKTDPEHCGSCTNACGTGEFCSLGRCRPSDIAQVITGLNQPEDIYVDAMNIYWTDVGDNTVWQADKFSFEKVLLADHQSKPWRVVTDGQKVYWTSNLGGGVLSTPIGGGTVELVYPANHPTGIAVDDSSIFWSNDGTVQIYKAPKVPGTGAPFLGHTADELYVDATRIYGRSLVPDSTTVPDSAFGVDKTTAAAVYYDQTLVPGLTVDSNRAYWYRAAEHYLSSALKNGTDRITQHFAAPPISFMKADDCHLFFVEPPHRIWNLPHASDRSSKLNVVTAAGTAIRRLAIDDRYVYWTDAGGGFIGRVAR